MTRDTLLLSGFPFKVSFKGTSMALGRKSSNNCLLEALAHILHTSETQEEAKKSAIMSLNYACIHLNILGFWATWSFSYMDSHQISLFFAGLSRKLNIFLYHNERLASRTAYVITSIWDRSTVCCQKNANAKAIIWKPVSVPVHYGHWLVHSATVHVLSAQDLVGINPHTDNCHQQPNKNMQCLGQVSPWDLPGVLHKGPARSSFCLHQISKMQGPGLGFAPAEPPFWSAMALLQLSGPATENIQTLRWKT